MEQVIASVLYALGMFGWGSEFAWHSWRAITRLLVPLRGIGGSFYSSTCIAAAIGIWAYTKNPPSVWTLLGCTALMPATFVYLRTGAFDSWHILGIDTRTTSAIDDLRDDAKSGRLPIQEAISRMAALAENHPDFKIRRFIVTSISNLCDPVALLVLRRFLKDRYWQVQYAAIVGIRRLALSLDAKGVLSDKEGRSVFTELESLLNDPHCDSRLRRSAMVRQFHEGLRGSLERLEQKRR